MEEQTGPRQLAAAWERRATESRADMIARRRKEQRARQRERISRMSREKKDEGKMKEERCMNSIEEN